MKKTIIMLVILFYAGQQINAQFHYGIKAGAGFWQIKNDFSSKISTPTSTFNVGIIVKYRLPNSNFVLNSGLDYTFLEKNDGYNIMPNRPGQFQNPEWINEAKFNYHQFSIPLYATISYAKFEFSAGLKYDSRNYRKNNEAYVLDVLNIMTQLNFKLTKSMNIGIEFDKAISDEFSIMTSEYPSLITETLHYKSRQFNFFISYFI